MVTACSSADAKDKPWDPNCFYYVDKTELQDRFKQNVKLPSEDTSTGVSTEGWYYPDPTPGAPES